jgi:DNA-binding IscR family transcriptional regulator
MRSYYGKMLTETEPGLERGILLVLSYHIGQDNRIKRMMLRVALHAKGYESSDRHIREVIKALRRKGFLICSQAEDGGGYWLAKNRAEYEAFRLAELSAKRDDLIETMKAMDRAANEAWGGVIQGRLL